VRYPAWTQGASVLLQYCTKLQVTSVHVIIQQAQAPHVRAAQQKRQCCRQAGAVTRKLQRHSPSNIYLEMTDIVMQPSGGPCCRQLMLKGLPQPLLSCSCSSCDCAAVSKHVHTQSISTHPPRLSPDDTVVVPQVAAGHIRACVAVGVYARTNQHTVTTTRGDRREATRGAPLISLPNHYFLQPGCSL
jgi:hypothetical protein